MHQLYQVPSGQRVYQYSYGFHALTLGMLHVFTVLWRHINGLKAFTNSLASQSKHATEMCPD